MNFQIPNSRWIWLPQGRAVGSDRPVLALFRKVVTLDAAPSLARIKITADSRYKLFVNGRLVSVGPSKGDRMTWFVDEVDISAQLAAGENVVAVEVLRYPPIHKLGNHGVYRTDMPGLYVEDVDGLGLDADASWKCALDSGCEIFAEMFGFAPLYFLENRTADSSLCGWRNAGYDDSAWADAKPYNVFEVEGATSPGQLTPRSIPLMRLQPRQFVGTYGRYAGKPGWDALLAGNGSVTVPANVTDVVEISAGELTTGFLSLRTKGGAGARVKILTSEGYVLDRGEGYFATAKKGDRTDWQHGELNGFTDVYTVAGGEGELYEPYWFRTFRFVRLEIETGDQPLVIDGFDYTEVGYPLEPRTHVETSDPTHAGIWDISLRTLRRCMHETYEDCPFYEQLQYAMDSRSQILYTYSVAADDRLARKCMDDFRRSVRPDGMINCSYPNYEANIIPGFSIYYILMLHDHMMYFGDKEFVRGHMSAVDGILEFFRRNLNEQGLVGHVGGKNGSEPYWSFIDWTSQWDGNSGSPTAGRVGPITMESMLYVYGLQHAAELMEWLGRDGLAAEYRERAAAMRDAINAHCTDQSGMYTDGPGVAEYSQHCQVFAILTGIVDADRGRELLEKTLDAPADYAQCSVAMAFYLFRAMEKVGLYARTDERWELWRTMLKKNLTTCVEDDVRERSDCHAWGALALYELPGVVLGVRPAAPGYAKLRIAPNASYMTHASGEVLTPRGVIKVEWTKRPDGELDVSYELPQGLGDDAVVL